MPWILKNNPLTLKVGKDPVLETTVLRIKQAV